jgi:hypothetical protein
MELGKAGTDGIGMMWRIGVLGPKVFPVKAVGKGWNNTLDPPLSFSKKSPSSISTNPQCLPSSHNP